MTEEILATEVKREEVDTQEPTVTVAEMQRRLAKEQEKHSKELDDAVAKAVEKATEEAKLSGKELEEYRRKEQERKDEEREAKIAELQRELNLRDLKDEAIKTLNERKIPVNDDTLAFVVHDTAEAQAEAIDRLGRILEEQRIEMTKSEAPIVSGGSKGSDIPSDTFGMINEMKRKQI